MALLLVSPQTRGLGESGRPIRGQMPEMCYRNQSSHFADRFSVPKGPTSSPMQPPRVGNTDTKTPPRAHAQPAW